MPFVAQARRKHTFQSQNSRSGAVFDGPALIFMHRRHVNAHCAQARCFAKLCKTIAPVSEKRSSAKLSKTISNLTALAEKVRQPCADSPLFFALSALPAAQCQKRQLEPFPGASPGPSRAPPGPLPDGSRTPLGRLPGTSRTPSAHSDAGYMPKLFVLALYDV